MTAEMSCTRIAYFCQVCGTNVVYAPNMKAWCDDGAFASDVNPYPHHHIGEAREHAAFCGMHK